MTRFTITHHTRKNQISMSCDAETLEDLLERLQIALESPGWDKIVIDVMEDEDDNP